MPSEYSSVVPSNAINSQCEGRMEGPSKTTKPAGWKPPATSYWTHSVYRYNKNSIKGLPVMADVTRKTLRAYFNMLPRDHQDDLKRFLAAPDTGPSLFRAFVSDRGGKCPSLKQHLVGKISGNKNSFWRPFRRLMELQPKIVFKHYPEETRLMFFVYDRRIATIKSKLLKLARRSIPMTPSRCQSPSVTFRPRTGSSRVDERNDYNSERYNPRKTQRPRERKV
jgi:hypothetical protein